MAAQPHALVGRGEVHVRESLCVVAVLSDRSMGAAALSARLRRSVELGDLETRDHVVLCWVPGSHAPRLRTHRRQEGDAMAVPVATLVRALARPGAEPEPGAHDLRAVSSGRPALSLLRAHLAPQRSLLLVISEPDASAGVVDAVRRLVTPGVTPAVEVLRLMD